MKLTKKLLSLILAGTMVIGSAQPVGAADYNSDEPSFDINTYEYDEVSEGSSEVSSSASSDEEEIIFIDDAASTASSDEDSDASTEASTEENADASSSASSDDEEIIVEDVEEEEELPEDFYTVYPVGGVTEDSSTDIESVSDGKRSWLLKSSSLPSEYTTPNLPTLRNQGQFGTCWAFATTALADINLIKNGHISDADMSELHLAYYTYNTEVDPLGGTEGDTISLGGGELKDHGGNAEKGLNAFSKWVGVASESTLPYTRIDEVYELGITGILAYEDAAHIVNYYEEPIKSVENGRIEKTVPNIKALVNEYGAVYVSFHAFNSMSSATTSDVYNSTTNAYYNPDYKNNTNHAVAIVGWDDNFSKDNFAATPPGDGAFLIRNSWRDGTNTAADYTYAGYFWMSYYEATLKGTAYAAEFVPASDYSNNYEYDGGLGVITINYEKSANVFTTHAEGGENGEELGAVSFYTDSSNVDYTVDIYMNLTDPNNPESGEHIAAATTKGVTTYAGMYRVKLKEAVPMKAGTTFSVVVTLKKDGSIPGIGVEYGWGEGSVSKSDGQSFIWFRNAWSSYGGFDGGNIKIKAYTNNLESDGMGGAAVDIALSGDTDGELTIGASESGKLTASVLPYNASDRELVWTSSDESIATVASNGLVTGVGIGTAVITVSTRNGNISKTVTVNVINKLLGLSITVPYHIYRGETYSLNYTTSPENYVPESPAVWSTKTPKKIQIDPATGEMKVLEAGNCSVTVTLDGETRTKEFTASFNNGKDYGYTLLDDNSVEIWWKGQDDVSKYEVRNYYTNEVLYTVDHQAGTENYSYTDETYKDNYSGDYVYYSVVYYFENTTMNMTNGFRLHQEYSISYELDGGTQNPLNPSTYVPGRTTQLYPATKEGYAFAGWYRYSNFNSFYKRDAIGSNDYGNITLYAKFVSSTAGINYVLNGGTQNDKNPTTYTIGETVQLYPPTPQKGYAFDGWYLNRSYSESAKRSVLTGSDTDVDAGDITLYAKYTRVYVTDVTILKVNDDGSTDTNVPEKLAIGETLTLKGQVEPYGKEGLNTGYYWRNYGSDSNPSYISCYPDGVATATIDENGNLVIKALSKGNVSFSAVSDENKYISGYNSIQIINANEKTITYVIGDYAYYNGNPDTYFEGTEVELEDPQWIKNGYQFEGWYLDAEFSPDKKRTKILATDKGDLTFYAKFDRKEQKITYIIERGTQNENNPLTFRAGDVVQLYDPIPDNDYRFEGWYLDSYYTEANKRTVLTEADTSSRSYGITLFAKFSEKTEHNITYVVGEHGTPNEENPDMYSNGTVFKLLDPITERGYAFEGWYLDQNYSSNKKRDSILASDKTDLTFYAKIVKIDITGITVTCEDGFGNTTDNIPTEIEIGDTLTFSAYVQPYGKAGLITEYYWKNYGTDDSPVYARMNPADAAVVSVDENGKLVITGQNAGDDSNATVEITAVPEGDVTKAKTLTIRIIDSELQIISADKNPKIYGSNKSGTATEELDIATGKNTTFKTRFIPQTADKTVIWASSNPAIASVDGSGRVTAKSAGYADITATNGKGNIVSTARVNVYDPVTAITLDKKAVKLGLNQTFKLEATTMPATASDVVYYSINKPGIIQVDENGYITAIGTGSVTVTVKSAYGEKSATCSVTVGNAVNDITVSTKGGATSVAAGKTMQLSAVFNGGDKAGQPANKDIVWEIVDRKNISGQTDETVASISDKGVISAKKAGAVTVVARSTTDRAQDGSYVTSDPVTMNIYVPMSKATLNTATVSLYTGKSYKLAANLVPAVSGETVTGSSLLADAAEEIEWALKNAADAQYLDVTGNSDGTCTITALDYDDTKDKKVPVTATIRPYGAAKATILTCNVTVSKNGALTKLAVSTTNLKLNRGADADISAILTPLVPENAMVKWTIVDTDLLSFVDEAGDQIGSNSTVTDGEDGAYGNRVRVRASEAINRNKTKASILVETIGTNAKGVTLSAKVNVTIGNEASTIVLTNGKNDVTWDAAYNASNDGKLVQVEKGKSVTFKAAAYEAYVPNDAKASVKSGNQAVTWTSSDPTVATINASGRITALKPGQTWVTAVSKDVRYSADSSAKVSARALVYVYAPATKVSIDKTKATLGMEVDDAAASSYRQYDVLTIMTSNEVYNNLDSVNIGDDSSVSVADKTVVTWTVNAGTAGDEMIAVTGVNTSSITDYKKGYEKQNVLRSLDDEYRALAKGESFTTSAGESLAIKALKPGTVTLTAMAPGGKKATCAVTIYTHVQDVKLKLTWKNSEDNNTVTLGSYSNPVTKIVTVAKEKKNLNILEESDGTYDYVAKLDTKNNKSLKLTPVLDYYAGDNCAYYSDRRTTTLEKNATAYYTNIKKYAVNSGVNYRSSNPSVVAVAANGTITVKGVGTGQSASAVVTISTADGSIQKRILVRVKRTAADWVED